MDGTSIFARSSRAGCYGGFGRRPIAAKGSLAVCRWDQHGDQLGPAVPRNRQRFAGPNGRPQAESNRRRAPRLAAVQDQGKRFHLARPRHRARSTRPQGRLQDGMEFRPYRETQLQKKPCSPASKIARTSRVGVSSGKNIRPGSRLSAWSSSMRVCCRDTEGVQHELTP
jgi:hypothetical protein